MRTLTLYLTLACWLAVACKTPQASTTTSTSTVHAIAVAEDVRWASPEGFDLTMDIYTPQTGRASYPVIVMFHGGGWLINDNSIMGEAAAYLASHGEYVVCNVNYRLLGDQGNTVTMDEIIGDAFGATLWVREHIKAYKGDPSTLIVTGDSAGGHLAAMVATQGRQLCTRPFGSPDFCFTPSYQPADGLPEGGLRVQAAMLSYGAFDHLAAARGGFESEGNIFWQMGNASPRGILGKDKNPTDDEAAYKAVSPAHLVASAKTVDYPPMLFTVGSRDDLTTPASIAAYVDQLKAAGHDEITYWVHEGRPHAYLDAGSNAYLGIEFARDAVPALDHMLAYLSKTL